MRKFPLLFGLLLLVYLTSFADEPTNNSYLQEYQNMINQTDAKTAAMARANQEMLARSKMETGTTQTPIQQPAQTQQNHPWVKPNPWAAPPAQSPVVNMPNQTTTTTPPNIFAPPKTPAPTNSNADH